MLVVGIAATTVRYSSSHTVGAALATGRLRKEMEFSLLARLVGSVGGGCGPRARVCSWRAVPRWKPCVVSTTPPPSHPRKTLLGAGVGEGSYLLPLNLGALRGRGILEHRLELLLQLPELLGRDHVLEDVEP